MYLSKKKRCYKNIVSIRMLVIIVLSFFGATIVKSQDVYIGGLLTDQNNIPVSLATIKVMRDSVTISSSVTDSLGNYSLKFKKVESVKSQYFIQAFFLRSQTGRVPINCAEQCRIGLQIVTEENTLNEVVVRNTLPSITRKADRLIFVPSKLMSEAGTGVDILSHTPMLLFNENTELISIVGKSNTVVYINNKKSQLPKELLLQTLRSMPAGNIKSIEIITQPGSEYAANTSGGVININVKREYFEGWQGNVSIQTQQSFYNTTLLNGALTYRKRKLAIQLVPFFNSSYNYKTTAQEIIYANGNSITLDKTNFRRYFVGGGGLNLDYDIDKKHQISISTWYSSVHGNSSNDILSRYKYSAQPDNFETSPYAGKDRYEYKFVNANLRRLLNNNGTSYVDFNVDYHGFNQQQENSGVIQSFDTNGVKIGSPFLYHNVLPQRFENISTKLDFVKPINAKTTFKIGIQGSSTNVVNDLKYNNIISGVEIPDNNLTNRYTYTEKYVASYASLSTSLSKKVNLSAGLRFERTDYKTQEDKTTTDVSLVYNNLFPSLALSYTANSKHQWGFAFSRKISRPNIELLFPGRTYINSTLFAENDPFLRPSLIYNTEFSYAFNSKYIFFLTHSYGDGNYANFIQPVFEGSVVKYRTTYLNYGQSHTLSLVANLNQSLIKNLWDVNFTPSIIFNQYIINDKLGISPVKNNLSTSVFFDNYLYLSKKAKWTLFVTFQYNSPRHDVSIQTLNGTSTIDLQVRKTINSLSFAFFINDIYNGASVLNTKLTPNSLIATNSTTVNSFNRSVSLRVRYSFGNSKLKAAKGRSSANEEIKRRASK